MKISGFWLFFLTFRDVRDMVGRPLNNNVDFFSRMNIFAFWLFNFAGYINVRVVPVEIYLGRSLNTVNVDICTCEHFRVLAFLNFARYIHVHVVPVKIFHFRVLALLAVLDENIFALSVPVNIYLLICCSVDIFA